uniref:Uncharacterized protein n=1 Tax=Anguilla anguilla TaxID=7936 RepID=A0A0E9UHW4_ANGAN
MSATCNLSCNNTEIIISVSVKFTRGFSVNYLFIFFIFGRLMLPS